MARAAQRPDLGRRLGHRLRRGGGSARAARAGAPRRLAPHHLARRIGCRTQPRASRGLRDGAPRRPRRSLGDLARTRRRRDARLRRRQPLRLARCVHRPALARHPAEAPAPGLPDRTAHPRAPRPPARPRADRERLPPSGTLDRTVPGRLRTGGSAHRERLRHRTAPRGRHRGSARRRAARRSGRRPRRGARAHRNGDRAAALLRLSRALCADLARRSTRPLDSERGRVGPDRGVGRAQRQHAAGAHASARARRLCGRARPERADSDALSAGAERAHPRAARDRCADHRLLLGGLRLRSAGPADRLPRPRRRGVREAAGTVQRLPRRDTRTPAPHLGRGPHRAGGAGATRLRRDAAGSPAHPLAARGALRPARRSCHRARARRDPAPTRADVDGLGGGTRAALRLASPHRAAPDSGSRTDRRRRGRDRRAAPRTRTGRTRRRRHRNRARRRARPRIGDARARGRPDPGADPAAGRAVGKQPAGAAERRLRHHPARRGRLDAPRHRAPAGAGAHPRAVPCDRPRRRRRLPGAGGGAARRR